MNEHDCFENTGSGASGAICRICGRDPERAAVMSALRAHAVNDLTRAVARDGITLTHAEADELAESTLAWMRARLGLRIEETDRGVVCTSGYQSTENAGDRQEV